MPESRQFERRFDTDGTREGNSGVRARLVRELGPAAGNVRRAVRRAGRGLWRRIAGNTVRIVYHTAYKLPADDIADPRRAERILGHLLREGWASVEEVIVPRPVTLAQLLRVHDIDYLESLDDPRVIARIIGGELLPFHSASRLVTTQRWQTAGTVHAAQLAVQRPERFRRIVNLGGGFHHAHAARGEGFCMFNDVAVAIEDLRASGFQGRILTIDLDLHHGNGLRGIFANRQDVFTLSVHADHWDETPAEAALDIELGPAVGDATYLRTLREVLPEVLRDVKPTLIFYVAGVDVAADDRLGGWRITSDGVFERDRLVYELAGDTPIVAVLAGGYGPNAWRYSARTLSWLAGGDGAVIPSGIERGLIQFRRIADTLGRGDLTTDTDADPFKIREEDLYGDLFTKQPTKLLGFYSQYGIELAMQRYGLLEHLEQRGYPRPYVRFDPEAPTGQSLTIYADPEHKLVLLELVVRTTQRYAPYQLLFVEWLLLQDPKREPSPERPLLPGQQHPGLGCLSIVVGMLLMACERLGLDGLGFVPAHYHVAAQARGMLQFLDPGDEARFTNLSRAVSHKNLRDASQAIEAGLVVDTKTGQTINWKPALMVLPVSAALREQLEGAAHSQAVEVEARSLDFELTDGARE